MIELKKLSFENIHDVLQLRVDDLQKNYVEEGSFTIALAYAGLMEGAFGELLAIYHENTPVGIVLIGKSAVGTQEPSVLQQFREVYRLIGFLIDSKYQNRGFGKQVLEIVIQKIYDYPDGKMIPITLEVKEYNSSAIRLYKAFSFYDTQVRYEDDCVFVRLPK